jgi:glycosyltransferase involved in cell wall biosynthesis
MHALAVVIPAYNPDFFRTTLASVAAQTDRRFCLYVGDDAGPSEIARAVAELPSGLEVVYRRYEENLGGLSLAGHWNRCVALSSEPWVWLFSDDDVMSPDCVASFYAELERGCDADVFRFDTEVIDAEGRRLRANPRHPTVETGVDFIYSRLSGARHSYVVEYVFRRKAWERAGGFPDYPAAWCSDDAAWFLFSRERPIRTLSAGTVSWRASGRNISTSRTRYRAEKLAAAGAFLRFVRKEVVPSEPGPGRAPEEWARACERWYLEQLRYPVPLAPRHWLQALRHARGVWRAPTWRKLGTLSVWAAREKWRSLVGLRAGRSRSPAGSC